MEKPLYVCYSVNLRNWLSNQGIRYEVGGKSISSNNPFWVYVNDARLQSLLKQWTLNRNN